MSQSWDQYFIRMAELVASKSKDPSTKVGCVIVGPDNEIRSTGFNGFPRGVVETVKEDHQPVTVMSDPATRGWKVQCTCGEVIQLEPISLVERRGGFDVLPEPGEIEEKVLRMAYDHEHFNQDGAEVLHPERWERPLKYDYVEHAERNAIYNAARVGIPVDGCRAYLNWEPHPCKECTKAFIQAGIIEVIGPNRTFSANNDWKFDVSATMAQEAGMAITEVEAEWESDTQE